MSKSLINLPGALYALLSAVASFWRCLVPAGFMARRVGGAVPVLRIRTANALHALRLPLIAGPGLHARAADVSVGSLGLPAVHLRSRALRPLACAKHVFAQARSTTAFGLFDATRERGMGHPAG